MRSGTLTCEPFLNVGLIASIRRVLVITLQSSEIMHAKDWSPEKQALFQASMIELGVLAGLIITMVFAIFLLHRAGMTGNRPVMNRRAAGSKAHGEASAQQGRAGYARFHEPRLTRYSGDRTEALGGWILRRPGRRGHGRDSRCARERSDNLGDEVRSQR